MVVQLALTLGTIVYLSNDQYIYRSRMYKYCEIGSEYVLLLITALMQQFMRIELVEGTRDELQRAVFATIGFLIFINLMFLIYTAVLGCRESKRKKLLNKKREENIAFARAKSALMREMQKKNQLGQLTTKSQTPNLLAGSSAAVVLQNDNPNAPVNPLYALFYHNNNL